MLDQGRARGGGDLLAHRVVALEHIFAAPAVEAETGRLDLVALDIEQGPGVAQPDVAELAVDDLDPGGALQQGAGRSRRLLAADHKPHAFPAGPGQGARQGGDLALGGLEVVLPQVCMARETQPHGGVRGPFSRNSQGHRRTWSISTEGDERVR